MISNNPSKTKKINFNMTYLKNSSPITFNKFRSNEFTNCLMDSNLIKSKALEHEILVKNSKILNEKQMQKKEKLLEKSNKFYNEYKFGIPLYYDFKPKFSMHKVDEFLDEKIPLVINDIKSNGFLTSKTNLNKINKKKFLNLEENIFSPKPKIFNLTKIQNSNGSVKEKRSIFNDSSISKIKSPEEKIKLNKSKLKKIGFGSLGNNPQQNKLLKITTQENSEEEMEGEYSEIIEETTSNNKMFMQSKTNSLENFVNNHNKSKKNTSKNFHMNNTNYINCNENINFNLTTKDKRMQIFKGNNSIYSNENNMNNKKSETLYSRNNRITFRSTDALTNKNVTGNKYYQTNFSNNNSINNNFIYNNNNIEPISSLESTNNINNNTNKTYKRSNSNNFNTNKRNNNSIYFGSNGNNNNKTLLKLESKETIIDDKISSFCITGKSELNEYEDLIIDRFGKNNNANNSKYKMDTKTNFNRISNHSINSFDSSKKILLDKSNYNTMREERNPCGITLPFTFNESDICGNIQNNMSLSKMKLLKKKENTKKENENKKTNDYYTIYKNKEKNANSLLYKFEKYFDKSRKKMNLSKNNAYHFNSKKKFIHDYDQEKMSFSFKVNPVLNYPDLIKDTKRFSEIFEKNTKHMVEDSKKKQDKLLFI